jgi:hypothetical protein
MSNLTKQQATKNKLAKNLGVSPDKIAMYDFMGNNLDEAIPVYSPTLAYLLCAVHNQKPIKIVEIQDSVFATFKTSKVVENAVNLWLSITDKYKNGDHMEVAHLMGEYVKRQVSEKDMKLIENFYGLYAKYQRLHFKNCKDCSQHDKSS